jgi:transposase-like protein
LHEDVQIHGKPDHRDFEAGRSRNTRSAVVREHGMSSASFYKWRSKYGGMDAALMSRMKELETENARLKKMYAEERLKAEVVREALEKKW